MHKKQVILIMGPTAAGKTDLAIELSKQLPCDLISVDSAMIYKNMDIGTGKPTQKVLNDFPHALVDILDPSDSYSVGDFCDDAHELMLSSINLGRIPLLVGGTMMYFWALREGLAELPQAKPELRSQLLQEANQYGWLELHKRLSKLDPTAANNIKPTDTQRIQRALEVIMVTNKPLSDFTPEKAILDNWNVKVIKILPEKRADLHARISTRFLQMLDHGFIEEVEFLFNRGDLSLSNQSIRCVGYRQIWQYIKGAITYTQMVDQALAATRQLAKRQLTWLQRWNQAQEISLVDHENIEELVKKVKV